MFSDFVVLLGRLVIRAGLEMCLVRCGFCHAHLFQIIRQSDDSPTCSNRLHKASNSDIQEIIMIVLEFSSSLETWLSLKMASAKPTV